MGQTMINFRLDEHIKRDMESACREMGLSMTAAFTIFATKVGRERRIPFELTAQSNASFHRDGTDYERDGDMVDKIETGSEEELTQIRVQAVSACDEMRRALTRIHTAIPATLPGLTVERIRMLCGDELKDKTAMTLSGIRSLLSDRNLPAMAERDIERLERYAEALFRIRGEVRDIEDALVPALRTTTLDTAALEAYEVRLSDVSREFDGMQDLMACFLDSKARKKGTAQYLKGQIQRAAEGICDDEVIRAIERLEKLTLREFDGLPLRIRGHLETHYLQTLSLTLEELGKAEEAGEASREKADFCLRVIHVMEQAIVEGKRVRDSLNSNSLEAEVIALERIAAMRGDIPTGLIPHEV